MAHTTSCRNVVSVEHTASTVFVLFWLVLLFIWFSSSHTIVWLQIFDTKKLRSFQNLRLGFIPEIFLKFRKFQPRYSYKMYSI